mmetsp:Transcript_6240/g.8177  ORF Transcript_6240/g.8177 Transcript_6240/m.8177 type:complete len:345 (-) Transcript_6240:2554-3588(-)
MFIFFGSFGRPRYRAQNRRDGSRDPVHGFEGLHFPQMQNVGMMLPFFLMLPVDPASLLLFPLVLTSYLARDSRFDVIGVLTRNSRISREELVLGMIFLFNAYFVFNWLGGNSEDSESAVQHRQSRSEIYRPGNTGISIIQLLPFVFLAVVFCLHAYRDSFYNFLSTSTWIPSHVRNALISWSTRLGMREQVPRGAVPTSRKTLKELKDVVLEENHLLCEGAPSITCPVCLERMVLGTVVKRLPCKHFFHPNCVLPWLEKHCTCPSCRYELPTDSFVYEEQRNQNTRPNPSGGSNSEPALNLDTLMRLDVASLKRIALTRNVDTSNVIEKRELVERILARTSGFR